MQILADVHPLLAWIVGITFVFALTWGIWKIYKLYKKLPLAPIPPKPQEGKGNLQYLKEYYYYLKSIIQQLENNKNLSNEIRKELFQKHSEFRTLPTSSSPKEIEARIEMLDKEMILPAFDELNEKAEIIVKDTVRNTMVGVMLLPFRAADIYLVVYRNGVMFFQLVKLYDQRPSLIQTYHILRDVLKMVVTVNILSYTERFTQRLMANVPILDKTTDDIIQGTGAGILTTAVGKATIQRCRAYSGWNLEDQIEGYRKTTKEFLGYIKDILSEDVLPPLSKPWKQAWGYLKGLFIKSEPELLYESSGRSKWKFWSKS